MIQSRFSSSEAVAFEFQGTDPLPNKPTLFVSHVGINFATVPTAGGNVQILISDDEGEDFIWEAETQAKTHLSLAPKLHIPVPKEPKLILRYNNTNSVEGTARFLWRV